MAHLEFLINASWVEFLKSLDDEKEFQRWSGAALSQNCQPPCDSAH